MHINIWTWLLAAFMWVVLITLAVLCWNAGKVMTVIALIFFILCIALVAIMELTSTVD